MIDNTFVIGDFSLFEGDRLDFRNVGIRYDTMSDQMRVEGNALVITPDANHTGVIFGVGNELTVHGGIFEQVDAGRILI